MRLAEGKKHGTNGLLNTDWGDYGNVNLPGTSLHGMAYGADCAWAGTHREDTEFDSAWSLQIMNDSSQPVGSLVLHR